MRWIKIDRIELAGTVVEFCERVYPFFRISSEVFLALLGLALPVPSLGFVFRYFSDDFKALDEGLQSAILVELQSAIVPRVIIFLFLLLMLRLMVERIANPTVFRLVERDNHIGGKKTVVVSLLEMSRDGLSETEWKAIEHVTRVTRGLSWGELVQLISSTMPVVISHYGSPLDMVRAADLRNRALGRT